MQNIAHMLGVKADKLQSNVYSLELGFRVGSATVDPVEALAKGSAVRGAQGLRLKALRLFMLGCRPIEVDRICALSKSFYNVPKAAQRVQGPK